MRDRTEGREYVETHKSKVSNHPHYCRVPEIERGMTMREKREAAQEKRKG